MPDPVAADLQRPLVVIAHPDDAKFWAGGTIAAWTAAGVEISYLVLTDGEAGGFDPSVPRSEIPQIRRDEQLRAAAVLSVTDVRFLGRNEGSLLTSNHEVFLATCSGTSAPTSFGPTPPSGNWIWPHP